MPPRAWSQKRTRQYEHIKEGVHERGEDKDTAAEIARGGGAGSDHMLDPVVVPAPASERGNRREVA